MAKKAKKKSKKNNEKLEQTLFKAADKLRKNMDAAEYKHIVLGLIFLKYISDSFEELHQKLVAGEGDYEGADPEDIDEYRAKNMFFVPPNARWSNLLSRAKLPSIGQDVDAAMEAIEEQNPRMNGVLPKVYARPNLDKQCLGQLIDLIGNIAVGVEASKSEDLLGRVYEYFLGQFASLEGKKGGQFYTPKSIVKLLVEMIEPYQGRVYDPCCGSGGMFVMSEKFVEEHQGRLDDISIYGQESNQTTYRLCRMNLAIRGIDGSQVKWNNEGSFLKNAHPDLKADFILANPPFNDSDWGGELLQNDGRWKYGVPPASNANYAWIQHFIYHLAPKKILGFVMHPGAASNKGGESKIRKAIVDDDVVDCIIYTPTQLFYNTTLPVHLWIINRNKAGDKDKRNRNGQVLMIDASDFGFMVDSTHRSLTDEDIEKISSVYHKWTSKNGKYQDVNGLCKSITLDDIRAKKYVLAPNRYIQKDKKINDKKIEDLISRDLEKTSINTKQINFLLNNHSVADKNFTKNIFSKFNSADFNYKNWQALEVQEVISEITGGEWGYDATRDNYTECKVIRGTDFPSIPLYNLAKIPTRYIKSDKVEAKKLREFDLVVEMSGGSKNQATGRSVFITKEFLSRYDLPILYSNFCKRIRVNTELIDPRFFNSYWNLIYKEGLTARYENQPSGIKNFQLEELISNEVILVPPLDTQTLLLDSLLPFSELTDLLSSTSNLLNETGEEMFNKIYNDYDQENNRR